MFTVGISARGEAKRNVNTVHVSGTESVHLHSVKEYQQQGVSVPICSACRAAIAQQVALNSSDMARAKPKVDAQLARTLEALNFCFVLADCREPDCPITYASPAFHELTGYPADEVIGRNCRFLQGPETSRQKASIAACECQSQSWLSTLGCRLSFNRSWKCETLLGRKGQAPYA